MADTTTHPDALKALHDDMERSKLAIKTVKRIKKILDDLPDDLIRQRVVEALDVVVS